MIFISFICYTYVNTFLCQSNVLIRIFYLPDSDQKLSLIVLPMPKIQFCIICKCQNSKFSLAFWLIRAYILRFFRIMEILKY